MQKEGPDGKRRRTTSGQGMTYRDKVLQVVKAKLAEVPDDPQRPAPRLPEKYGIKRGGLLYHFSSPMEARASSGNVSSHGTADPAAVARTTGDLLMVH